MLAASTKFEHVGKNMRNGNKAIRVTGRGGYRVVSC
jgi:hypothetical protein